VIFIGDGVESATGSLLSPMAELNLRPYCGKLNYVGQTCTGIAEWPQIPHV
jgi:hypothetical protein